MTSAIERWMSGYIAAWDSNAPEAIGALFADDAEYRSYPWGEPARGVDAIVAQWVGDADQPGDHRFEWHVLGVDGERHFVQGRTTYADGRVYENLWVVDLGADGSASAFTEWYMESAPKPLGPGATAAA